MNEPYDFAVLMSVYQNDETNHFLEALNSVTRDQTLKPSQVVIVKDGPVNAEIDKIINRVKKENGTIQFDIVSNDVNKGLAYSLNAGAKFVKTKWIARMDADDIAVPNRFELQMDYLKNNSEVSILGGFTEEFNKTPGDLSRFREVPTRNEDIVRLLKKRNALNHPTVVFKKEALEFVNGYSTDCGKMEDYRLWVDFMLAGYVFANLNCVLVNMRVGAGFLGRRSNKEEISDWKKLQKYICEKKIISRSQMNKNIFVFSLFVSSPTWVKRIAYSKLLRKGKQDAEVPN